MKASPPPTAAFQIRTHLRESCIIAAHELRRIIRTPRAALISALYVLGAAFSCIIFFQLQEKWISFSGNLFKIQPGVDQTNQAVYLQILDLLFGDGARNLEWLTSLPPFILFVFKIGIIFLPFLTILTGFDGISSELSSGALRYIAPRAHRSSVIFGKAISLLATIGILTLILFTGALIYSLIGDGPAPAEAPGGIYILKGTGILFAVTLLIQMPYIGLTLLCSSMTKTPLYALILCICGIVAQGIIGLISKFDQLSFLQWLLPSHYENLLFSDSGAKQLAAAAATLAAAALLSALGILKSRRTDL